MTAAQILRNPRGSIESRANTSLRNAGIRRAGISFSFYHGVEEKLRWTVKHAGKVFQEDDFSSRTVEREAKQ